MSEKKTIRQVAENRKARHDYFIEDSFEAGIELAGAEVKSIRQGKLNLKDSFCVIKDGEIFIRGMHISPYEKGSHFNTDPVRPRRLLMHKSEIVRLFGKVQTQGLAIIPLSVYFNGPRVKVQVALCKGKKMHDKRASEAKRDAQREISRAVKEARD